MSKVEDEVNLLLDLVASYAVVIFEVAHIRPKALFSEDFADLSYNLLDFSNALLKDILKNIKLDRGE